MPDDSDNPEKPFPADVTPDDPATRHTNEAEALLASLSGRTLPTPHAEVLVQMAQVHALLAIAALIAETLT